MLGLVSSSMWPTLHCSKPLFAFFQGFSGSGLELPCWVLGGSIHGSVFCSFDPNRFAVQAVDLVPFRLESTLLGLVCKKLLYSSGQNPGPIGMVGLAELLRFFEPLKP